MKHKIFKRKGKNTQAESNFRREHKSLFRRTAAFVIAATVMAVGLPIQQIADNIPNFDIINKISNILPDAAIKVAATDTMHRDNSEKVSIDSGEALVAYVNGELKDANGELVGYNEKDDIFITLNVNNYILKNFVGIGTEQYPFAGTITIGQAFDSAPYGDFAKLTWENSSLFNYVTTDAVITNGNTSDNNKYIYFQNSGIGNEPLFAKHIVAGENDKPRNWHIIVNASASSRYGGVIGELGEGAKANINVGYLANSDVSGGDDVGGICNTMLEKSALSLSVKENIKDTNGSEVTGWSSLGSVSANKFAGGVIGQMKAGAVLTINEMPEIISKRTITATDKSEGNAAGGLVGNLNEGAKVVLADNVMYVDSAGGSITVTGAPTKSSAGGVFGYYGVAAGDTVDIDLSRYKVNGNKTLSANADGGFIGRIILSGPDAKGNAATVTIDGKTPKIAESETEADFKLTADLGTAGGVVGKIFSDNKNCLENIVIIKNVKTNVTTKNGNSGGIVGDLGYFKNSGGRTYLKIEGTNHIAINKDTYSSGSGGIAFSAYSSFLDIGGENTITGNVEAGVVDKVVDYGNYGSVVRLSGKTDISKATVKTALLVNLQTDGGQDDALIYALGSGSNYDAETKTGWTYIRSEQTDTKVEDVAPWGQVIRLIDGKTIEEAGVVKYDKDKHTVTLKDCQTNTNGEYEINDAVDFMKLALCIQHNTVTKNGAFTTKGSETSANILKKNITLTSNIDLSGTGLRGLTRDDGRNNAFTGTFNGNGHKITLAIGEAYGYRGTNKAENTANNANGNTGAVYMHAYQGLFSKISGATVKNLTIDGSICIEANIDDIYCGAVAAHFSGSTIAENVNSEVKITVRKDAQRIDVGTIFGVDSDTATVILNDCTSDFDMSIAGIANSSYNGVSAGTIAHVKKSGSNVAVNGMTISGTLNNSINLKTDNGKSYYFYGYGGLIGVVEHQITKHDIKLNNVNVSDFTVNDNSNNNGTGGLLGGSWNNVNVTIGDNSFHDKGITVSDSKIKANTSVSKTIGGLVTSSYGYWQVNSLKYINSDITGQNDSVIGLIVGIGYESRTLNDDANMNSAVEPMRLYLEITDPDAYDCKGMTYTGSASTYDEIVGKTIKSEDTGASAEGFVSIRTTGNVLNMSSDSSNEYKPQTNIAKPNPYTRYYYNLDYLRTKDSLTGGEKAALWSAYTYAAKNIRNDYFNDYSKFPTDTEIDLNGLSYYPVDIDTSISLENANVKLCNKQIQEAHGTNYSTWDNSQHYLMQCGLFRNVTGSISFSNCKISGTAAAYRNSLVSETDELNVQGSGAIICGNLNGTVDQKANLTISGLVLNGLTIDNLLNENYVNKALLVCSIYNNTETKISGVSTTGYSGDQKAAWALIGTAGGPDVQQMSIQFSDMCLDGRSQIDNVSTNARSIFEKKYGTTSSIFTKATLINTLQYNSGSSGSSAIYNYNYKEDWNTDGTAKHNVTYGKEISHSKEFAPDAEDNDQRRYLDMHAADDKEHFTSPESAQAEAKFSTSNDNVYGGFDFSNFLPYVADSYDMSTNKHEIAVNHVSKEMSEGCGTYNDPFIIDDGTTLSMVADILSKGTFNKGFSMYIDNDYLSSKDVNFEKWDSDKDGGTNHTRIGYNGSEFVAVKKLGDKWEEDSSKSITISSDEVRAYFAGAYYLVEGNYENGGTITLSEKFAGLGQADSNYAFRGVIKGKKYNGNKMVIVNHSDKPLVPVSNGCVIKDLDIRVNAEINLTNNLNGANGQLTYVGGTPVYGAVIGKIMGGDNVIDAVSVKFSDSKIQLKTTDNTVNYYKYTTVIPVGGYVGAVVNGGLVFRNMGSEKISPFNDNVTFKVYKNTNTETADNIDNYLYVNQIVGRVVNAYCFNEAYSYKPESSTLDNSENNYPIPDLNADSDSKISFKLEDSRDKTTMVVPNSQSLFILSEITQSMCGNAGTASGSYTVKNSYGDKNKATHIAKYSEIGTNGTDQPKDFELAKRDSAGNADAVPYIIRQYTEADENGSYPARAITSKQNYHYMELAKNAEYDLPNCFRGIGQLYPQEMEDEDICKNIIALCGLDGKGSTIKLNTKLKNYSSSWDCYYKNYLKEGTNNADKIGLGLFNDLYFDVSNKKLENHQAKSKHRESDITNKTNSIHDLILSGTLTQEQWNKSGKITMTSDEPKAANTGGIVGALTYTKSTASRVYNFWNVSLDNLNIYGERATGGIIGYIPDRAQYIYVNECSANELTVKGTLLASGGVVGHMEQNVYLFVNTFTEQTSAYNVSVTSDNSTNNANNPSNCGGIVGQSNNSNIITIRNVTVTAAKNGCLGYDQKSTSLSFNGVGGAIGRANNGQVLLINFKLENVDLYGKNTAGLIGNVNGGLNFKAYNCKVEGKDNEICGIEHTGGLFGYCNASNNNNIQYDDSISYANHIDGCSVSGYQISAANAGGLIGTNNYDKKICNSKVENCKIEGKTAVGGAIGSCPANVNVNVNAYNIVVNGITLSGSKDYYGLFSGYSKGKTFKIVGWSVQGTNSPDNKIFGGTSNICSVIPADYNGVCLDENAKGEKLSDITKATNIRRVNTDDDNFPYATSSPAKKVGTGVKFLTGDGTSAEAVKKIIAEYNDKTNSSAKRYSSISATDITKYNELNFSTEQDILKDIPVILIDNTDDIKDQINSYLSILTNNQMSSASAINVYKANINDDEMKLASDDLTVTCSVTGNKFTQFKAKSDKFDSDTRGQFTLIDVQFYDPTNSKSTDVVYHIYVPVITRKIYQYDFFTTVFSGTQYYPTKYTDETGDNGFNGGTKVLIENYNTPVTSYLRWAYPTETFISDIMYSFSGLNWNYKKQLSLTENYGRKIPAGTLLVLIDKNNNNKEYYYTVTGSEDYSKVNNNYVLTLSLSEFKDIGGNEFGEVDFADMVSSQLKFTKTAKDDGHFVEDSTGDMQVNINGRVTTIRAANDGDANRFDLSTDVKYLTEDYYLTMTTAKAENVLNHQFQLTSPSSLYPNKDGKLNGVVNNNHSVQLNFVDLFSNTIEVKTLDDGTNVEMNDVNNNVNVSTVSTIKFNATDATTINNLKTFLTTNGISIYHSNHIFMNKRSVNAGAVEKIIGDTDNITIINDGSTITAYDKNKNEITSPPTLNYTSVSGDPATNFFEVSEQNNGTAIDLRPWLTAGGADVAPTVKITTNFKITYSHSGIITQFPERQKSDEDTNIGTLVSARSSLAFDSDDTTYSNNVSATADDTKSCLYYRNAMTDVNLKFNAYYPVSLSIPDEDRGDGQTKANNQLGINVFDEETDMNSVIHTRGVFDASQLSAIDKQNLKIRWTIELQCKNDSYSADLNLSDYLNSVTVKDVNEHILKTFNSNSMSGTKLEYSADRDNFEETDNAGLFDVYIDLDVKTGADFEKVTDAFYSNYRIVLTASLFEGSTMIDGSIDNDYIIYTNAHLDAKFIDKVS